MTKDDIKGLLFSLAWCTWSNWHTGEVLEGLEKLGFTEEEAREQVIEFTKIIESPAGEGSPK